MDFYYDGAWRMDWGLDNPNKTATLIAGLMIAAGSAALIGKKFFWPALAIFVLLAWCLVQTFSRGGMIAFIAGAAVLLLYIPRSQKSTVVAVTFGLLATFAFIAHAPSRYLHGLDDPSITHRLAIWKQVPAMMAAAPWGWGWGRAGDAYTQWFQPVDESQSYLNLINSHFNFMVEFGWLASTLYIFAWLVVLLLCQPTSSIPPVALAIWTTFGVGACFTHVVDSIWLWILPLTVLTFVLWKRGQVRQWPSLASLCISGVLSVLLVAIFVSSSSPSITFLNGVVTIGSGRFTTLIMVDRAVLGSLYGHTFRKFLNENSANLSDRRFYFVESGRNIGPASADCVIVCGRFAETLPPIDPGARIVFLNPANPPDQSWIRNDLLARTTVYFGEYAQMPSRSSWSIAPSLVPVQIDGAGSFVPIWPSLLLPVPKTPSSYVKENHS